MLMQADRMQRNGMKGLAGNSVKVVAWGLVAWTFSGLAPLTTHALAADEPGAAPASPGQPPAQVEAPKPGLTVLPDDGVKSTGPTSGLLDYGVVDSGITSKLEHDFVLQNDSKSP